jgi:hypothetical protein
VAWNGGAGLEVAAARACDQIVDREIRRFGGARDLRLLAEVRASVARFDTYASQQPFEPHEQRGQSIDSSRWPNSPARL